MGLVRKSEFAKKHNISKQYINKLIKQGKLFEEENGFLDEEESIRHMAAQRNMDKSQRGRSFGTDEIINIQTMYTKAKLKNELVKGELLKMEAEEKAKTLMPASVIEETLFTKGRVIRDALMNIPDRISSLIASIDDEGEVHNIISTEIRVCLEELTRGY